jgi:hypothetical protein
MGGEVTPGGGEKCSDAKICGPGKNVRTRTNLPTKGQNLFGQGSKIQIFSGPRSREGRIFRDIFCGVIISIPSRVKIHIQHVFGLQSVSPLHKFPVDYHPPYPECTDNSTDLSGVSPNFCSDCNRPHGNFGSKFVRTPEPASPPIFRGPRRMPWCVTAGSVHAVITGVESGSGRAWLLDRAGRTYRRPLLRSVRLANTRATSPPGWSDWYSGRDSRSWESFRHVRRTMEPAVTARVSHWSSIFTLVVFALTST